MSVSDPAGERPAEGVEVRPRADVHAPAGEWIPDTHNSDVAAIARIDAVPSILDVVCRTTGMGFAAVARVTEDRWIACSVRDEVAFGLKPGGELKVDTTICHEIRESGRHVVIDHVAADDHFAKHPTPAMYGFQSYISVPIRRGDGSFFGTLCAIDPKPLKLNTPATISMFQLFADLIAFHLDAQERLATAAEALLDERQTADLREAFIAVLGHDLRNPLASIDAGTRILQTTPLDEKASTTVSLMQTSVRRMAALIDDVMDFARGRLGGGLNVDRNADAPLEPVLRQVIDELRALWPNRLIRASFSFEEPVDCDRNRVAQLLSNLLANALVHGAQHMPVSVEASSSAHAFELTVSNAGDPIPPTTRERLFQPFFRDPDRSKHQGLGLGLYIASEIARAHGGTLAVASTAGETRFTFRMPTCA